MQIQALAKVQAENECQELARGVEASFNSLVARQNKTGMAVNRASILLDVVLDILVKANLVSADDFHKACEAKAAERGVRVIDAEVVKPEGEEKPS